MTEPILSAVSAEGYTHPTPIQREAIPTLLDGRDVLGIAQTGTGKTAAFVLPLVQKFAHERQAPAPKMCKALVLSPTRELAAQIVDSISQFNRFTGVTTALVVGGVRPGKQIRTLGSGVDIVVATPGRLLDHINSGAIILAKTNSIILDEADQMLDLGFLPAIRTIMSKVPSRRQTAMFSATMPKPIGRLADDFLNDALEVRVAPVARPIERITQKVEWVDKTNKRRALVDILTSSGVDRTIVFARTKRGVDRVCKYLHTQGLQASSIHGDKSQGRRDCAIAEFASGKVPILVATDVASRGIDIDDVSHVINFDIPNVPESYVHRIGRTARAGRSGTAISLCDPSEKKLIQNIEKLIGSSLTSDVEPSRPLSGTTLQKQRPKSFKKPKHRASARQDKARRSRKLTGKLDATEQPSDGLRRMFANIALSGPHITA